MKGLQLLVLIVMIVATFSCGDQSNTETNDLKFVGFIKDSKGEKVGEILCNSISEEAPELFDHLVIRSVEDEAVLYEINKDKFSNTEGLENTPAFSEDFAGFKLDKETLQSELTLGFYVSEDLENPGGDDISIFYNEERKRFNVVLSP